MQRRRRQLADRAQHVVLASATFDPDGRLLVTQEGLMPSQKITRQYNQRVGWIFLDVVTDVIYSKYTDLSQLPVLQRRIQRRTPCLPMAFPSNAQLARRCGSRTCNEESSPFEW